MKSEIIKENQTEQEIVFPCLMIHPDTKSVIIATKQNGYKYEGYRIANNRTSDGIMEFYNEWSEYFEPLPKGQKIILEND